MDSMVDIVLNEALLNSTLKEVVNDNNDNDNNNEAITEVTTLLNNIVSKEQLTKLKIILRKIDDNDIMKQLKEKIKEYDIINYVRMLMTRINLVIISWLFFPDYYDYMVALLLVEDNMEILNKTDNYQNKCEKVNLFIPWLLFNNILNYTMFGSVLNLIITIIIFTNRSMRLLLIKIILKYWFSLIRSKKIFFLYNFIIGNTSET